MAHWFNVHCMLCGRAAGQLRDGKFRRHTGAPPLAVRGGQSRCGYCGGSLYLEAEDSPFGRDMGALVRVPSAQRAS
jgi:hypothetical protein